MSDLPRFELDRIFQAPRELVWRAWTDPVLLARWYGPGVETIVHKFEPVAGGLWLGEMRWGETANFSRVEFQEVVPPERMVWHHCSSDAEWNVVSSPMMPDWPNILLTTVVFDDLGDRTKVRLSWVPFEATEAEIAFFAGAMDRFGGGWEKGYAIIDEILAELQAASG